jgi:fatty acid desaturase
VGVPTLVREHVVEHRLSQPSPPRVIARTAAVVALYLGGFAVGSLADRWWVWLPVWAGQAVILVGSFAAMHEATHGLMFRSARANRLVAMAWGSAILVNASMYRAFHFDHHANTTVEGDPEGTIEFKGLWQYLLGMPIGGVVFVADLFGRSLAVAAGAKGPAYVRTERQRRGIKVNAIVQLVAIAGIVAATVVAPSLVWHLWLAPFLAFVLVTTPVFALPEHYGCDRGSDSWTNTRTVRSNALVRLVVWNANYHAAHHMVSSVPAHNLPALDAHLGDGIDRVSPSYTRFHAEVVRSLATRRPLRAGR